MLSKGALPFPRFEPGQVPTSLPSGSIRLPPPSLQIMVSLCGRLGAGICQLWGFRHCVWREIVTRVVGWAILSLSVANSAVCCCSLRTHRPLTTDVHMHTHEVPCMEEGRLNCAIWEGPRFRGGRAWRRWCETVFSWAFCCTGREAPPHPASRQ